MSSTNCILLHTWCIIPNFFFNDTATTEIYTLSLHDALPIFLWLWAMLFRRLGWFGFVEMLVKPNRSEEHTSELQSRSDLVCRLLLEKKKKTYGRMYAHIQYYHLSYHDDVHIDRIIIVHILTA